VGAAGEAAPGGRQDAQTMPPAGIAKAGNLKPGGDGGFGAAGRLADGDGCGSGAAGRLADGDGCGSGAPGRLADAPQRAHSCRAGAYPATASERNMKASSTSLGSCSSSPRDRSPPMSRSNCRSAGSFSTGVKRSAVSSIATPTV
jgi:hypothetical protein